MNLHIMILAFCYGSLGTLTRPSPSLNLHPLSLIRAIAMKVYPLPPPRPNFQNRCFLGDAETNLGCIFLEQKKFAEALPFLERAVELRPESAAYLNNLAVALFESGQRKRAVEVWQKALKLKDVKSVRENLQSVIRHLKDPSQPTRLNYSVVIQP